MGMPDKGDAPESLNDCEFYMQTRDNIEMFRYMAAETVKMYEKGMGDKLDERARPTEFYEGDLVYMYNPLGSRNKQSKFSNNYKVHRTLQSNISKGGPSSQNQIP